MEAVLVAPRFGASVGRDVIVALACALVCALAWLVATQRALARATAAARRDGRRRCELGLELMRVRNSLMHSDESLAAGRHPCFALRSSDVAIVTFPKCGTTWMQAIVQGLRSGGALDYDDICEEIPWDILALDCGQDLDAEQRWHPRVFKSHEPAHSVAQGGRYIVVLREPADALVSFWRFLPAYAGLQPGDVSLEAFAGALFSGVSVSGQIWHHLLGWWQLRAQPHVLVVTYEDLKRDLCGEVAAVAHFLGMQPGPARDELVARVAAQCTLDAMTCAQHARKFDDHFVRAHVLPRMRCAPAAAVGGGSGTNAAVTHVSKARRDGGRVGYALPPTLRAQLDAKWAAIVEPQTGLRNYAHLCAELRREREARVAASGLEPAAPGADGGGARAGGAKVKAA